MRTTFLAPLAAIVLAAGLYSTLTSGQELPSSDGTSVLLGTYKPLTLWDSISLGASYYTNPQRVKATSVAYSFNGPEFSDKSKSQELWTLAGEGKVFFGLTEHDKNNTIDVVPLSELQKQFRIFGPADLTKVLAKENVFVVYNGKTLLGEDSKTPVVKTAPKK